MNRYRSRFLRIATRAPLLLGAAAGLLLPWAALLGVMLPSEHTAQHWQFTWVGFDLLMAAGCAGTALLTHRGNPRAPVVAAATAAIAIADAWFDVATANPGGDFALSLCCAIFAELPLAAYCIYLALRTPAPVAPADPAPVLEHV